MFLSRGALAAFLVVAGAGAGVAFAQPQTVTGRVSQVFGDQFVLTTPAGNVLVTPPSSGRPPQLGADVAVTGERDGDRMVASHMELAATPPPPPSLSGSAAPAAPVAAGDAVLPDVLRGLGITVTGSRDWSHGKREVWGRLADGTPFEVDFRAAGSASLGSGQVYEIETKGHGAVLPASLLARFVPDLVSRNPRLAEISGLYKIEISDDGQIEIEGRDAGGREIEAEFDRGGRMTRFQHH